MRDNIIPFDRTKFVNLTTTKIANVQDQDDVLADKQIHLMMQHFHTCGTTRSLLSHEKIEPRGVVLPTFAEQNMSAKQLAMYGNKTPTRGIHAPLWHEKGNIILTQYLQVNLLASRIYTIASCAWFHGLPISTGILSMLLGNQTNNMASQIKDVVEMLTLYSALIKTDTEMLQPISPPGVSFSKDENIIYVPSRRTLYRDIEKVMFLLDALSDLTGIYSETMWKWTNRNWPSIDTSIETCPTYRKAGQKN